MEFQRKRRYDLMNQSGGRTAINIKTFGIEDNQDNY